MGNPNPRACHPPRRHRLLRYVRIRLHPSLYARAHLRPPLSAPRQYIRAAVGGGVLRPRVADALHRHSRRGRSRLGAADAPRRAHPPPRTRHCHFRAHSRPAYGGLAAPQRACHRRPNRRPPRRGLLTRRGIRRHPRRHRRLVILRPAPDSRRRTRPASHRRGGSGIRRRPACAANSQPVPRRHPPALRLACRAAVRRVRAGILRRAARLRGAQPRLARH